jgi:hypothetical protein
MARVRLKYVTADRDRHGNVRYYFRRRGLARKTRIPGELGSKEFMAAYAALLDGRSIPTVPTHVRPPKSSLRWLFHQYLANPVVSRELDSKTLATRNRILNKIADEPLSPSNPVKLGEGPFDELTSKAVRRLLERKADKPAASNDWLKALKAVFKWAVKQEHTSNNPVRDIEKMKLVSDGFHTWTLEEVAQYEAKHAIGTTPRLALALFLYTGQRKSDVVLFGPQHVKDGWLRFTQQKNRNRKPVILEIPVLQELNEILVATKTGHLTFRYAISRMVRWGWVTELHRPRTSEGRSDTGGGEWCDGQPTDGNLRLERYQAGRALYTQSRPEAHGGQQHAFDSGARQTLNRCVPLPLWLFGQWDKKRYFRS